MLITRRECLMTGTAAAATAIAPLAANAQQPYPSGLNIKIVVPFAPGGSIDVIGRIIADRLTAKWGVPVVIENVSGAAGDAGHRLVAKGPADGTLFLLVAVPFITNQFLRPHLSYDLERDVIPVSCVARLPNLLVVTKRLPVNSVAELIAYAEANPGKLNYGSPGAGSSIHLTAELFKRLTGTKMTHVAYRGSAPAMNDLVAGHIDLMFNNITSSIDPVRQGQVRGLAVTSAQRSPLAPEFPTVAETVPGFDVSAFFGIGVRAGTSTEIVAKIEKDVVALSKEASVRDRFAQLVTEAVGSSSAEFTRYLAEERARWGPLIRELGIRAD
jgi:tripartite-type tricarboxylate transporter receptor subunit TctC